MEESSLRFLQNAFAGMAAPPWQPPIYMGSEQTDMWVSDLWLAVPLSVHDPLQQWGEKLFDWAQRQSNQYIRVTIEASPPSWRQVSSF